MKTELLPREPLIDAVIEKYNPLPVNPEEADRACMTAALELAALAAKRGEVPVGCVIARRGRILSADFNGREETHDPTFHAECAAIRKASALLGGWRLPECTLYVTLEPCPMCAGALWNARVPRVVIGAKDPKAGALGSLLNLNSYPLNHKPALVYGVMERECAALLREFFLKRRGRTPT